MSLEGAVPLYGGAAADERGRAFLEGRIPVAVYGLGKMGLPLAAVLAEATGNVVGADVDPGVVAGVNEGESTVSGEPGLDALVAEQVAAGALSATTDLADAAASGTLHVLIVPTTLEGDEPDLSTIRAAASGVAAGLDPGDLVAVESTVPPGTCADVLRPLLAAESGLAADAFGVAFCPERTASGRALADIRGAYPKVVGGVDAESTRAAAAVYERLVDNEVLRAPDARTAECVKLFEGVYRDVNIALANELARHAEDLGVDVTAAIDLANTQPFCDLHDPGVGVGGHCIPYYPHFLLAALSGDAPLVRTARRRNDEMPRFVAGTVVRELDRAGVDVADAAVGLLGLAYRPGVAETRASPAAPLAAELASLGAAVYGVDPVIDGESDAGRRFALERCSLESFQDLDLDAVVLVTAHRAFEAVDWEAFEDLVVVDGRDALSADEVGHPVYTIGGGRGGGDDRER